MVSVLAAMALLPAPVFGVDLFLVANNPEQVKSLDFLDNKAPHTSIERALFPALHELDSSKKPFILVDGGDCSLFFDRKSEWMVKYLQRDHSSYVSATETVTVGHRTQTRVLETASTTSTQSGGVYSRGIQPGAGYVSAVSMHFGDVSDKSHPVVTLQDPNSVETTIKHGQQQDVALLPNSIAISRDGVVATQNYLDDLRFSSVALCATGFTRDPDSDYVAFPPPGVIAHYMLYRKNNQWRLHRIEFIR